MATRESSQKGGRGAKGRGFHRETVEKGLDGKDRRREGYRHPIKKCSESSRGNNRLQTDTEAEAPLINAHTAGCGIETAAEITRRTQGGKK